MKQELLTEVLLEMREHVDNGQLKQLEKVMRHILFHYHITKENTHDETSKKDWIELFIAAKRIEGCSAKTLVYYRNTIDAMVEYVEKDIVQITTDDIRKYLMDYQNEKGLSKVTVDNIRRIMSSFFAWLEDENYIIKSPARRIHKIRVGKTVKDVYSDEELERMRDNCNNSRDLAIIDILSSTGIRVGELVNLNISDIDLEKRECIVLGKGNKQRKVYFDARTKIHLNDYITGRYDECEALFVSLNKPHNRLSIRGIEVILQNIGSNLKLTKVHPHKFRRTLATKAIDKGMPIEQVQVLLGHSQIDTTLRYAMVNQNNVKVSHHKYIG